MGESMLHRMRLFAVHNTSAGNIPIESEKKTFASFIRVNKFDLPIE